MNYDLVLAAILLLVLPAYWFVSRTVRTRQALMVLASLAVIAVVFKRSGVPTLLVGLSLVGLQLANLLVYLGGRFLQKNSRLTYLFAGIAIAISGMFYVKLAQTSLLALPTAGRFAVSLGISYYTFKWVHYLIDSSRGNFVENDFLTFSNYILFFPMFLSGPIERYQNFYAQAQGVRFDASRLATGLERILIGLGQKLILSDLLLSAFMAPPAVLASGEMTYAQLMFASLVRFLTLYFDFSGYTSMAIGVGLLFGIKLMENFNFPLFRPTLAEFWRNWHISLSSWARDYVYFPMLMKYRVPGLALICTMLTIGLWHSLMPGWVFWGLHHGIGLTLLSNYQKWVTRYEFATRVRASKVWWIISVIIVWWYVSLGFSLTFNPQAPGTSLAPYLKLISFGAL